MTQTRDRSSGFFDQTLETLPPENRNNDLNLRLTRIVRHAYANAPAIRAKFDKAKIAPESIRTIADLVPVPITHKHELTALQQQDPPFGGFLGLPLDRLRRICMSPGPIYEPEDREGQNDRWDQALYGAGFRAGDMGQITFSYHLVPVAFWFEDAFERLGVVSVPGGVGNTEQQVRLMHDLKVSGYVGTPSFLMAIAKKAREMGYDPAKDLTLQVGFVAAEMLPEPFRAELEAIFGMIVRQGYGTADVGCLGFECAYKCGMHVPHNCIVEIVDPQTGKQLGPGEPGEIVATVFDEVYPMIRFGTGDLSVYTNEPCACGRTTPRLLKILGRTDEVTKVKGMFIHPANAEQVAAKFSEIDRFQVVVTRKGHEDQMTFDIELKEGCTPSADLAARITAAIPEAMRVKGKVSFIDRGSLPASFKKIDDRRKWD